MSAVSNTTPLRYLIAIGQAQLLTELFDEIIVPSAVHEELTHPKSPHEVSRWVGNAPAWYTVRDAPQVLGDPFSLKLDRGEQEAILLAEFLKAKILLIDDQLGRAAALSRNLLISGTLGVLESADGQGLLGDFPQTIMNLKAHGFFLAHSLERELLRRHHERWRTKS